MKIAPPPASSKLNPAAPPPVSESVQATPPQTGTRTLLQGGEESYELAISKYFGQQPNSLMSHLPVSKLYYYVFCLFYSTSVCADSDPGPGSESAESPQGYGWIQTHQLNYIVIIVTCFSLTNVYFMFLLVT